MVKKPNVYGRPTCIIMLMGLGFLFNYQVCFFFTFCRYFLSTVNAFYGKKIKTCMYAQACVLTTIVFHK